MAPIEEVAATLGVPAAALELYGRHKAKLDPQAVRAGGARPPGKLVLVSAITPTPAGEGKTTTTIGLGDALRRQGKRTAICLREPSLGPCFGQKGGAAGGGYAQVVPMEDINLHFTGDFHAIGLANNLLAAALDNHLHQGNALQLDSRRMLWRRVMDMNDRALRQIVVGLGGAGNSFPRETGFDITAASEIMAILCLAEDLGDLQRRIERIVVGHTFQREPVTAGQLKVTGAMTALLREALKPNLVQTLEGTPALVHGGPFANIAHGCNSLIATRLALQCAEYTVTEAGFGADLGAEKFLNIKCRQGGLEPDAVVLVATVRALKHHGGVAADRLTAPDPAALAKGIGNLRRHIENIRKFGLPVAVAVNQFVSDSPEEIALLQEKCDHLGVRVVPCTHWADGGAGAAELADTVVQLCEKTGRDFRLLYPDSLGLWDKIRTVAQEIYGADDIMADKKLRARIAALEAEGHGQLPVCIAKTQYSFSTDPGLRGAPRHFDVPLRDVRLAAGAGFVVVLTGEIMTMPGLPRRPAAEQIGVDGDGRISGLF